MKNILLILILSSASLIAAPTPEQSAAIKRQIAALQADMEQKQRAISHQSSGSHGAYRDMIESDRQQIYALNAQLR